MPPKENFDLPPPPPLSSLSLSLGASPLSGEPGEYASPFFFLPPSQDFFSLGSFFFLDLSTGPSVPSPRFLA